MFKGFTSIKRTMALAGAAALSAGSFAFMLDTNIVIERALNSPTLTVKYDGTAVALVELRINGSSFATRSVNAATTKGESTFTMAISDLKDGENEVEIRLFDKTGKVVGSQKQTIQNDQADKGPIFIAGPKQGASVQGVAEIKLGFGKEMKNSWVSFFIDGDHKFITNEAPFKYVWDTQKESNGWHTVEAWVVDEASNTFKSKPIKVFVNNPGGRTPRHGLGSAEPTVSSSTNKANIVDPTAGSTTTATTTSKPSAASAEPTAPKDPAAPKAIVSKVVKKNPTATKSPTVTPVATKVVSTKPATMTASVPMGAQDMTPTGTRLASGVGFAKNTNFALEAAGKAVSIERGTRLTGVTSFNVLLNGEYVEFDVQPRVDEGVPMTPFRHLLEKSGGLVEWLKDAKVINASGDGKKIWLKVGDSTAKINDMPFSLELAPYIDRGRTIVPLSFMKDALGVNIQFDPSTGHVLITKK